MAKNRASADKRKAYNGKNPRGTKKGGRRSLIRYRITKRVGTR